MNVDDAKKCAMNLDEIVIAILNAPNNGMPPEARKALNSAAISLVSMVFNRAIPPLEAPEHGARLVQDVVLLTQLLHRWGAEEEMKRKSALESKGSST